MTSCCFKRKREENHNQEEFLDRDRMEGGIDNQENDFYFEQNKRGRRDDLVVEKEGSARQAPILHLPTIRSSRPPTIDEQRAWVNQSLDECSEQEMELDDDDCMMIQRGDSCSLWMNVQGDGASSSQSVSSTPPIHEFFQTNNGFQLSISTPTGHPHPYAQSGPSRSQLGTGYFDLMR